MILWFLSLFTQFRDLAAASQAQARAIEEVDDKYAVVVEERDGLAHDHSEILVQKESLESDLATLREAHDELATEKLLLQDRLESAIADKDNLWKMVEEALGNERGALRAMVNHANQRSGAGVVFPDAHILPHKAAAQPQDPGPIGPRGRVLRSQMVAQANRDFIRREYMEPVGPHEAEPS